MLNKILGDTLSLILQDNTGTSKQRERWLEGGKILEDKKLIDEQEHELLKVIIDLVF